MAEEKQAPGALMRVTVAQCMAPGQVKEWSLTLAQGATARSALDAVGLANLADPASEVSVGIWGKACPANRPLQDGDRVEVYRPLLVDPKVARRERFAQQGSRGAGLFARDRSR